MVKIVSNASILLGLSFWPSAQAGMADLLRVPHKAHTRHMMLCIPEVDMVACDKQADGTDAADVMYEDGSRMVWWDEYNVNRDWQAHATAMISPKNPNTVVMKADLPTKGMSSGVGSEEMWADMGVVEMDGDQYQRYALSFDDTSEYFGNENLQMVEGGLVPDRFEYYEAMDGQPSMFRSYSNRNDNTMYSQTMFMMIEELKEDELEMDLEDIALNMARDEMANESRRRELSFVRKTNLRSSNSTLPSNSLQRRAQDVSVGFSQFELPQECLEDDDARACFSVFRAISNTEEDEGREFTSTIRLDTVLRDSKGRSAELFGEIVTDPTNNQIVEIAGGARGCSSPGSLKIKNLVGVSVTNCMQGSLSREGDGSTSGSLALGVQFQAMVFGREASLDIEGEIEVMTERGDGGAIVFSGFAGRVFVGAGGEIVALGVVGEVHAEPADPTEGSGWVTFVYVTPSIEWNLWFWSGSAEHQFRIAQIGPRPLVPTSYPRNARISFPVPSAFRSDDVWSESTVIGTNTDGYERANQIRFRGHQDSNGMEAAVPASSIVVIQNRFRGQLTSMRGVRTISARDGEYFERFQGDDNSRDEEHRFDLDDDEWVVRVSGRQGIVAIHEISFDTNKGRHYSVSDQSNSGTNNRAVPFEMVARDQEALYGFDAYVSSYLRMVRPEWYTAPEIPCTANTCLMREADPISGNLDRLMCTGWPATSGFRNNRQRCLLANDQIDDGYEYVYNSQRGTADAECGIEANCWCCRRSK